MTIRVADLPTIGVVGCTIENRLAELLQPACVRGNAVATDQDENLALGRFTTHVE
jgi:hypothetical protein